MAGVGRRFRPKEEFLIKVLELKAKRGDDFDVSLTTAVPGDLSELYMYGPGKEPWNLFSGPHEISELSDSSDVKRKVREKYVVSKLSRIGKKKCCRVAGAGYWVVKSTKRPVYVRGQKVGHWRTLIYEYAGGDGGEEGKFYYFMNELHLSEPSDYVVCRVMKNLTKTFQLKFGTKCLRRDGDLDCPAATKRRRSEEIPEPSFCSQVVPHHPTDEDEEQQEYFSEQIDFSGLEVIQEENIPVYDPNLFSCDDPQLPSNICVQQQQVDSFCDADYSASVYVPDMFGIEQNQEQPGAELWDYPEMQGSWVPSCSNSTMPDQDASVDQWSLEEVCEYRDLLKVILV